MVCGGVGLQLQGMRTGLGRGLDDLQRDLQGLVMVAAHLGNDERRRISTDQALANLETSHRGDPSNTRVNAQALWVNPASANTFSDGRLAGNT